MRHGLLPLSCSAAARANGICSAGASRSHFLRRQGLGVVLLADYKEIKSPSFRSSWRGVQRDLAVGSAPEEPCHQDQQFLRCTLSSRLPRLSLHSESTQPQTKSNEMRHSLLPLSCSAAARANGICSAGASRSHFLRRQGLGVVLLADYKEIKSPSFRSSWHRDHRDLAVGSRPEEPCHQDQQFLRCTLPSCLPRLSLQAESTQPQTKSNEMRARLASRQLLRCGPGQGHVLRRRLTELLEAVSVSAASSSVLRS